MQTIRPATQQDAEVLPDIERSSGEVFRQIPHLAWIADDTVKSHERHEALIGFGAAWVSLDASYVLTGFLTAEVREDALHFWQMSVRSNQQRKGTGRNLIKAAEHWARSKHLVGRLSERKTALVKPRKGRIERGGR
jgi:GNAT superfamily N-acetyltransferase